MSETPKAWLAAAGLALAALGALGGWWWQSRDDAEVSATPGKLAAAGIDGTEKAAIEALVRDYILEHPEILPEAMQRLQSRGDAAVVRAQRAALETPFAGAVLGNPSARLTLVEFSDYACGYCRQSVGDVRALIAAHPDLRIVVRELPILSSASGDAAEMALAAAGQGRYAAFHDAMFAGARPDAASIAAAARAARVRPAAATPEIAAEISANLDLARKLGINGTPAWVIGDRLLVGAVGREALEAAIGEARDRT
ncbi:MAG TPA: thioredoxin domain-containing protein [Novosphingobium sp.]|nr:thioredoxin domain-containing protein [Novosphingobium sp.]